MAKSLVTKANDLIRACYSLSISEQRVILLCISKIRMGQVVTEATDFEVTAVELSELAGSPRTSAYQDLDAAVERLYDRTVLLNDKKVKQRWVSRIYKADKGLVILNFTHHVIPFISELTGRFTSYNLSNVAKFKSAYAFRLYELMVQLPNIGSQTLKIERLRELLDLEDKYEKSNDFKRWVIEPAIKSINDYSDLKVTVSSVKKGREVVGYKFDYRQKRVNVTKITKEIIQIHARPGESWEEAGERVKREVKEGKIKL